jgi:hypothetical protein
MSESSGSAGITFALCVLLFVGNWWVNTHLMGAFNWLLLWPLGFILCVWIAGRFFRGHNTL